MERNAKNTTTESGDGEIAADVSVNPAPKEQAHMGPVL